VLRELSFYGLLISPLLVWTAVAFLLCAGLRHALNKLGAYRFVWHRSLFDAALLVIVLGVVAQASRWLEVW
jgi:hypothetical protein